LIEFTSKERRIISLFLVRRTSISSTIFNQLREKIYLKVKTLVEMKSVKEEKLKREIRILKSMIVSSRSQKMSQMMMRKRKKMPNLSRKCSMLRLRTFINQLSKFIIIYKFKL